MDFYDMVLELQEKYKGKIVLISCGIFYIAVGRNAILLNQKLNLKTNCAKNKLCKVGIPKNAISRYARAIESFGYGYIVLKYDKETRELNKVHEYEGEIVKLYSKNKGCNECENSKNIKITEYEKALKKYIRKEFEE